MELADMFGLSPKFWEFDSPPGYNKLLTIGG